MVVLATARDVTDEYKSKLQMKEAKEKSEAMVIAKSSFLANMSHEIRTPLNAIIAGSELLSYIPDLTAEQRELTDMVIRTSHTLLALVSDVLDFSKIEAEKLALNVKPFSIESCIDLSLEMQSIKANNKRLVLNYCIASNVPQRLLGDDMRIRQVVTNLISNAVKFTPKGSVELKIRPSSGDSVTLLFEVIDTGVGIPPDDQSELFTAFHQVNSSRTRSQQGTGLGLAICLKLVRLMQGDMSLVSSGVGCGSRFAFTAKLGRDRLEFQKQSTLFELEPDAKAQVRVLIAEDNLMNQKVAVKLLHSVGFRAAVVNNGKEALDLFVEKADAGESFDLILMDLQMPVMDGLQATREIFGHVLARPGLARPHIVALTADVAESVVEECKACQMHGFIAKPIKREKLNTLMEKITMWVMEGRQPQYELDGDGWTYR
ncbi:predicted protein [Micromonas commoda]|uniref:Histidine kinase n=1 Tax=Micromonas commoda (strain RCC299 / NOUM17 / CCMP2709) TaxID=296587 RepID=C1FGA4_MICCC|nr:predicted protein [Micromonas commoda]ACO69512.1 predicted protein [Micromonas commoda]|eukprot:XP_002508254.1 predicted protein [Micromonas commoda]